MNYYNSCPTSSIPTSKGTGSNISNVAVAVHVESFSSVTITV